jgi:ribonuclease-3
VLGLAVTHHLYADHPGRAEGDLARMRASVVSAPALAAVATDVELGAALRLGRGEESAGGRVKESILSDALEAVLGAVYLDGGWEAARRVIGELVMHRVAAPVDGVDTDDHKTRLQEVAVARFDGEAPRYVVRASGPDHDKEFRAEVWLGGRRWGEGSGTSKKRAEQAAAGDALAALAREQRTAVVTRPADGGSGPSGPADDEGVGRA